VSEYINSQTVCKGHQKHKIISNMSEFFDGKGQNHEKYAYKILSYRRETALQGAL